MHLLNRSKNARAKRSNRLPGLYPLAIVGLSLFASCLPLFGKTLAKYEPPDGSIYYGYCASGYWSEEGFKKTISRIENQISPKPFLLYSFFVHAKENGRWNGWEWRAEGPNGKPVHGSGQYLKRVRDAGYTPVIAWTWMDWIKHEKSPRLQDLVAGKYDWYLDEWIEGGAFGG